MTPSQCRMARTGLNWRAEDLSIHCGVSRVTIARFENGKPVDPASVEAMQSALVAGGADFTDRRGKVGVAVPKVAP